MAKYLITGGAGCIGSHLAEKLLNAGHSVVSLDNMDPFYDSAIKFKNLSEIVSLAQKLNGNFVDIRGDIRDEKKIEELFTEHSFDAVFHIAALAGVRPSLDNPVRYWDVNCTGTAMLLEGLRKAGIKKFIFASSSSVYGNCKVAPFKEDMFVGEPISPYAATKRAGELMCYNYSHLYGINAICIRFFTVYGPRQRPDLAIYKFTKLILEGKEIPFYGDGTSRRDYTYVSDVVDGLEKALDYSDNCKYDIINLGESSAITLNELIYLLEKYIGKKAILNRQAFQPGDVAQTWADISRAKERLGYVPKISKDEGIKKFVDWYVKNHPL